MMYNHKLASCIKVNGKVLREFKDTVYIPFGSEYTILIKNLETRRVVVNLYIDGDNVVPNGLVIDGGKEIELERSLKNGNLNEGNRFKFIERTGAVEQHRGIKLEDGLIRIEHEFEVERVPVKHYYHHTWHTWDPHPWHDPNTVYRKSMLGGSGWSDNTVYGDAVGISTNAVNASYTPTSASIGPKSLTRGVAEPLNDAGITVAGSKSDQKFQQASWFATENVKHSMVIKLLGETADNKPVQKPITVKAKPRCTTCGRQNKATAKFCTECGTSLELVA